MGDNFVGQINFALIFILLACVCEFVRRARGALGRRGKPVGSRIRFAGGLDFVGVAPAFLVHRIVLRDVFVQHPELGWFIASIYLICGAFGWRGLMCSQPMPPAQQRFCRVPHPLGGGLGWRR